MTGPGGDPEVPRADAQEQQRELTPSDPPAAPDTGVEVPEADAVEQSLEVPVDEEDVER